MGKISLKSLDIFFNCSLFIIGSYVFIVFTLRWRNSADFESNSTSTECRVVERNQIMACGRRKYGRGYKYGAVVKYCNNKILYRSDNECSRRIPVGEVRPCRVHNDCDKFKWNNDNTINITATFVGVGLLVLSVLFAITIYRCSRKTKVVPSTTTRQTPHQTSNPDDVELEIKSDPEIIEPEQPTKGCPDDMDSVV